ncbi:MAG: putative Na+/H+ antiporter [Bdellovibrionales bacterium]|nr:putative Na+/H+ antiporter [Bdellovibrionales bacterium]
MSIVVYSPIIEWTAAVLFGVAILHIFLVKWFHHIAGKFPEGSVAENIFHLLGEVEIVFGFWAAVFLGILGIQMGSQAAISYLESRNFVEPTFVFVVLVICAGRPILSGAENLITVIARLLPLPPAIAYYFVVLTAGPILGSFITEPAAMTVRALLLLNKFYKKQTSDQFKYATLGVLFVNVSIGGTLTHFAAPPVLMVASKWGWGLQEMLSNFGWKGALACFISAAIVSFRFRKDLNNISFDKKPSGQKIPIGVTIIHLIFLAAVVTFSHHPILIIGLFLFFLGFVQVTSKHHEDLKLKEGLLVAFFLGGLVVIGGMQGWWLEPILSKLTNSHLYLSAIGLTAFTDNAALTYLGTLVPSLSESSRYALVAGAVVGGGLTVIANAPNPAGFSILQDAFGDEGISPLKLFYSALPPTLIAGLCYWFL